MGGTKKKTSASVAAEAVRLLGLIAAQMRYDRDGEIVIDHNAIELYTKIRAWQNKQ